MTPLLKHVEHARLEALKTRLEEMSRFNADFLFLLSASTLIATFGLFQNSPAVIIGAMIIAPLMRPLAALSLATITADTKLLVNSLFTLFVGTVSAILLSMIVAVVFHSLELTDEVMARTHPTLMDLGVAIFAGAIGAFCQAKRELADSLAGVAISVALVPPLGVVGIGLAFNNPLVWSGALLLYATNLVGIAVAGALVFLILGFTPLKQAKNGLLISAITSVILVVPLAYSMKELIIENEISAKVKTLLKEKTFTFRGLQLQDVQVKRFRRPTGVIATVMAPDQPINSRQVALVQEFLSKQIGREIEFRLRVIPTNEITAVEHQPLFVQPLVPAASPSSNLNEGVTVDSINTDTPEAPVSNTSEAQPSEAKE
jgi:uncharacterized hydrophobic protein (TIGR00271 family)